MARLSEQCRGQWDRIFSDIAKWDSELMNGKHQPCPKCGGKDRFRVMDDFKDTGGLICNKCTLTVIPNGVQALCWALNQDENYVKDLLKDRFGVNRGRPRTLEFTEWTPNLVSYFLAARPGVTENSMILAGCKAAKYYGKPAYSFPIFGPAGTPCGNVVMDAMGGKVWSKKGYNKILTTEGSTSGLINAHAVSKILMGGVVKKVWKVEGVPDMLAMQALIPPDRIDSEVVVTNAGGCQENPKWMAEILAKVDEVVVVGDCDKPGILGAEKWAREIVLAGGKHVTIGTLPYNIEETHGKDLRDWINDGNTYFNLGNLSYKLMNSKASAAGNRSIHQMILDDLRIEVLGQSDNKVRCFSHETKRLFTVRMDNLNYHQMILNCGESFLQKVQEPWEKWDGARIQFNEFKTALVAVGSTFYDKPLNERGLGIWHGSYNNCDSLVLVNNTHVSRLNGQAVLERKDKVLVDGLACELGSGHEDWFNHDELDSLIAQANDPAFRALAVEQLLNYIKRFNWIGGVNEAFLATGMILATYLQTIWPWRPMVSVIGESGCGKTTLLEMLGGTSSGQQGLFGRLAIRMGHVTEAGLRQTIKHSGEIVLIDEFEASRERAGIMKTLRSSSRGDQVVRGTATGDKQAFSLRHIIWTATTETGLNSQPDLNRFVQLNMSKKHVQGWAKPPAADLEVLGRKLIACCSFCAMDALKLCQKIAENYQGDRRIAENVAPAAALLATLEGDPALAERYLDEFVKLFTSSAADDLEPEHEHLVSDIFGSQVARTGDGRIYSVYEVLTNINLSNLLPGLQGHGLKLISNRDGDDFLFVAPKSVGKKLLKGTQWEYCRISDYLKRVPQARRTTATMSGRVTGGWAIPIPKSQVGTLDF